MESDHLKNCFLKTTVFCLFISVISHSLMAQSTTVREETITIPTYPFDNPNPVPLLVSKPAVYPYHKFDGYSPKSELKDWKVITLENDYIKVMVLPEAGGKVWGAIDKSTGADFIYKNEVMKFRNIALRGPWTSGGIEFNFGYIGHTPSTASPVDYTTRKNDDGGVSCFVGGIDLPSRTQWRVEIKLSGDKSYFETNVLYFNPTNTTKSYYNWMTGAAHARDGFEMIYPGNQALTHSGTPVPWPVNAEGIEQNFYENNNFGSHVSQHVVGAYEDFFGGYYHDEQRGFGHIAPYEQMPGQKVWLWALSRSGGIWEDLLTDTDGQYMEFQAGRMLNQFSPNSLDNPITKAEFQPYRYDTWNEIWFPYNKIGGMVDASRSGVLNVKNNNGKLQIGLNALTTGKATIQVLQNGKEVYSKTQDFSPNQVFMDELSIVQGKGFEVVVEAFDLAYSSTPKESLKREFNSPPKKENTAGLLFHEGLELKRSRKFTKAIEVLTKVVELDPYYINALNALAEIYYNKGLNELSLKYASQTLTLDTYDPTANFIVGNVYKSMRDNINALESYGWAARSIEFRAAAYMEMGGIYLIEKKYKKAQDYLQKSLNHNGTNLIAMHLLAVVNRKLERNDEAQKLLSEILDNDPLNHLAGYELGLLDASKKSNFSESIKTELAYQAYLEMAMHYYNYDLNDEAFDILGFSPEHPMILGWKAFLKQSKTSESKKNLDAMMTASPEFVFPYRTESIEMLKWVNTQTSTWKAKYYLGLNYWAKDRVEEASALIEACKDEADYAPFYTSRGYLLNTTKGIDQLADLERALTLDGEDWRHWDNIIDYWLKKHDDQMALKLTLQAVKKFKGNYELGLKLSIAYLNTGQFKKCIDYLKTLKVLPFEGAGVGRKIYEHAHLLYAIEKVNSGQYSSALKLVDQARLWPENLGVGEPYDPDLRAEDFLAAHCLKKLNKDNYIDYEQKVVDYTLANLAPNSLQTILGLKLLKSSNSAKSDEMIQDMVKSRPNKNDQLNWLLAVYENNNQDMKKYADILKNDHDFKIVSALLQLK